MKLIIKSQQIYETHTEEYTEKFECSVEEKENSITISFENGEIKVEESKLVYEKGENKIVIEPNKINECDYETEFGMFVLDIKGISVEKFVKSKEELTNIKNSIIVAKACYKILITGVEPYENRIIIELSK